MTRIALLGEFDPAFPPHQATIAACTHGAMALREHVVPKWISTADLTVDELRGFSGLWIAPGSPYKNLSNTLAAIRYARERGIPCLGTCGGFQHMILEYARNALGFVDAQHAEYDPYASELFVTPLECALVGRELVVALQPESRVAGIYGTLEAREQVLLQLWRQSGEGCGAAAWRAAGHRSRRGGRGSRRGASEPPVLHRDAFRPSTPVETRASTSFDDCLRPGGGTRNP